MLGILTLAGRCQQEDRSSRLSLATYWVWRQHGSQKGDTYISIIHMFTYSLYVWNIHIHGTPRNETKINTGKYNPRKCSWILRYECVHSKGKLFCTPRKTNKQKTNPSKAIGEKKNTFEQKDKVCPSREALKFSSAIFNSKNTKPNVSSSGGLMYNGYTSLQEQKGSPAVGSLSNNSSCQSGTVGEARSLEPDRPEPVMTLLHTEPLCILAPPFLCLQSRDNNFHLHSWNQILCIKSYVGQAHCR